MHETQPVKCRTTRRVANHDEPSKQNTWNSLLSLLGRVIGAKWARHGRQNVYLSLPDCPRVPIRLLDGCRCRERAHGRQRRRGSTNSRQRR
jgi:hypothetical protein